MNSLSQWYKWGQREIGGIEVIQYTPRHPLRCPRMQRDYFFYFTIICVFFALKRWNIDARKV
jgi:hypothetical protein